MKKIHERGVSLTEYGIIITLLSATAWAVFATWKIWGWGEVGMDNGQGRAQIAQELEVDDLLNPTTATTAATTVATTVVTTTVAPSLSNSGGTMTVATGGASDAYVNVRYMGANAGLAPYSSIWMRVRNSAGEITDQQLTTDNTGAARTLVSNYALHEGDQVSFFLRVCPKSWSQDYYTYQKNLGRLTTPEGGDSYDRYYDVFSSNSTGPNNTTTVTSYAAGAAGNIFGTNEFHVGFEDLALDYSGCDRDYNDAEIRVAIDSDTSALLI